MVQGAIAVLTRESCCKQAQSAREHRSSDGWVITDEMSEVARMGDAHRLLALLRSGVCLSSCLSASDAR